MRRLASLFVVAALTACTDPPAGGGQHDAAGSADVEADPGTGAAETGATDTGATDDGATDTGTSPACAVATCASPCVFSFRDVADDRDAVREVRIGAAGGVGQLDRIELVDAPDWVAYSTGFVEYLDRITEGSWTIDSTRRFVNEGEPILIPDGESVAIGLRADDPAGATCGIGACGSVRVYVSDCASGEVALEIPIAR